MSSEVLEPEIDQDQDVVDEKETNKIFIPKYNVILWNDNYHTFQYVIDMLMRLFGHSKEKAFQLTVNVDKSGRVVVDTTTKERAELKRDQITSYGADPEVSQCKGSMSATVEPIE